MHALIHTHTWSSACRLHIVMCNLFDTVMFSLLFGCPRELVVCFCMRGLKVLSALSFFRAVCSFRLYLAQCFSVCYCIVRHTTFFLIWALINSCVCWFSFLMGPHAVLFRATCFFTQWQQWRPAGVCVWWPSTLQQPQARWSGRSQLTVETTLAGKLMLVTEWFSEVRGHGIKLSTQ